ncbi:probable peroxygenase 5 [Mangifera indica]|uniref:probable peroxygenase 5 n=1 Tax=Mangifera indica TaxID=29780 RepID=UPI001CFA3958|nr:probable peroxygenase 5 [Mangifera indica]XP_044491248.1 probable peroxygenase 5 [Mangifera indica]
MSFMAFSFFFFMASSAFSAEVEKYVPASQDYLQRHVSFFDRDHDGIIYPWETLEGMKAIGISDLTAKTIATLTHMSISPKTIEGNSTDPKLPIFVKNIAKAKFESDTGSWDAQGRFNATRFEENFCKHAHARKDSLTWDEIMEMMKTNNVPKDFRGWIGSYNGWKLFYSLAKDKNGLLHKKTMKNLYDGSAFYQLEKGRR